MSAPDPNENPPAEAGDSFIRSEALLLLLTFSVSLLTLLAGILRILLGVGRMFFALRVVVAMGLGGILVKFSCLIVSVFSMDSSDELTRVTAARLNPNFG